MHERSWNSARQEEGHDGRNEYGPGKRITPLTEDEVVEWCERHEYPGVLEDWFTDRVIDA